MLWGGLVEVLMMRDVRSKEGLEDAFKQCSGKNRMTFEVGCFVLGGVGPRLVKEFFLR